MGDTLRSWNYWASIADSPGISPYFGYGPSYSGAIAGHSSEFSSFSINHRSSLWTLKYGFRVGSGSPHSRDESGFQAGHSSLSKPKFSSYIAGHVRRSPSAEGYSFLSKL